MVLHVVEWVTKPDAGGGGEKLLKQAGGDAWVGGELRGCVGEEETLGARQVVLPTTKATWGAEGR